MAKIDKSLSGKKQVVWDNGDVSNIKKIDNDLIGDGKTVVLDSGEKARVEKNLWGKTTITKKKTPNNSSIPDMSGASTAVGLFALGYIIQKLGRTLGDKHFYTMLFGYSSLIIIIISAGIGNMFDEANGASIGGIVGLIALFVIYKLFLGQLIREKDKKRLASILDGTKKRYFWRAWYFYLSLFIAFTIAHLVKGENAERLTIASYTWLSIIIVISILVYIFVFRRKLTEMDEKRSLKIGLKRQSEYGM